MWNNLRPSLLAGFIGIASWIKSPRKAWRIEKEEWALYWFYRYLSKSGLIDALNNRPPEAILPDYNDLYGLHLIVMRRKPEVMLELGGGCSTFVLAQAAHDLSQKGHPSALYSVDQSEYWQQIVKDAMPAHLQPFVRYDLSDVERAKAIGPNVWQYESLPVEAANFVYVDGGSSNDREAIWADAYCLEKSAPTDYTIQVDSRKRTCMFLNESLQRNYKMSPGLRGNQTLFLPV